MSYDCLQAILSRLVVYIVGWVMNETAHIDLVTACYWRTLQTRLRKADPQTKILQILLAAKKRNCHKYRGWVGSVWVLVQLLKCLEHEAALAKG